MLILWSIAFFLSLAVLLKGADWFLRGIENLGKYLRLSPFIVGIVLAGFGTSAPEFFTAIISAFRGVTEIVSANIVGANITNIFLKVGIMAVLAGTIFVDRKIVKIDAPILLISQAVFVLFAWDGVITLPEGLALGAFFILYLLYAFGYKGNKSIELLVPDVALIKSVFYFLIGVVLLAFGAEVLVRSVIAISGILQVGVEIISLTAVSIGTSLPELLVVAKSVLKKNPDLALGTVVGSNIFNALLIVGTASLIHPVIFDTKTLAIALPFMIFATVLLALSMLARTVSRAEGYAYIAIYFIFLGYVI